MDPCNTANAAAENSLARAWRRLAAGLLAAAILTLAGCSTKEAQSQAPARERAAPVAVAAAVEMPVPVLIQAIGNVEAYSTVSVKPQVAGEVERAYFREGQDVKQGDLLFTLDRRSYEATLHQLEANLARNEAQFENARAQAQRYAELHENGIVSKEQYDSLRTSAAALEAAVRADQAAVERAKVDFDYCSIRAPIGGRTGRLLVYPGNVVKANDTNLVVINQIQPIYVSFSVPEQYLLDIKKYAASGPLRAEAAIPGRDGPLAEGRLTFIDNAVDTSTGTIKLMATFPNSDRRLWPGQFVNVALRLTTRPRAIVVPSQAVQVGQSGEYVFVIRSDNTTELRTVTAGSTVSGQTVIEKGVQAGEVVVTDGHLRLSPGVKVEVKGEPQGEQGNQS